MQFKTASPSVCRNTDRFESGNGKEESREKRTKREKRLALTSNTALFFHRSQVFATSITTSRSNPHSVRKPTSTAFDIGNESVSDPSDDMLYSRRNRDRDINACRASVQHRADESCKQQQQQQQPTSGRLLFCSSSVPRQVSDSRSKQIAP